MVRRERPWRAVASYRLAPGLSPVVMGRCYRATRDGLDRFIAEHEAMGCTVTVWKVQPIPEVDNALRPAYAPGDDCQSCGIPAAECGHVRPETPDRNLASPELP